MKPLSLGMGDLSEYLRVHQSRVGLTNTEIGALVNLGQNAVCMIMQGGMKLSVDRVPDFAKALDIPIFELLDRAQTAQDPKRWKIIIQAFEGRGSGKAS